MKKFIWTLLFIFTAAMFSACAKLGTTAANPKTTVAAVDQADVAENYGKADFEVPQTEINLAQPLSVSTNPIDVALCAEIREIIDKSEYSNARWGVFAASLRDGRILCEIDGRKLFNPASIEKTLTSMVALDTLGADFRWKTTLYAGGAVNDGVLNGNLYLYGTGAPDFDSRGLEDLANQLQAKGIRQITGNVIGDESYFRGENIGDGWTWNELQWYYGAEASALTFNENQAFVGVEKGNPIASSEFLQVSIGEPPPTNTGTESAGIRRSLSNNEFVLWGGGGKDFGGRVAVSNPALLVAKTLKALLEKRGIVIGGTASSADWKSNEKLTDLNSVELATVLSETLGEAVKRMNKRSDNLYAELILRAIGKKFYETAPRDQDRPGEVRGTDAAGAAYIRKWLAEKRVAVGELQIHDGSGLSRLDFVSPEAFVRGLIYTAQSPSGQVFADSLPIAATDGTLGGRLGKVKGKVIAKTGTITYVNSLTGYTASTSGETIAFSIICNNATKKSDANRVIDAITLALSGIKKDEPNANRKAAIENSNSAPNSNAEGVFKMGNQIKSAP